MKSQDRLCLGLLLPGAKRLGGKAYVLISCCFLFAQLASAQDIATEAEGLWSRINLKEIRKQVASSLAIPKQDEELFFYTYMVEKVNQVEREFYQGVYLGMVNRDNSASYGSKIRQLYAQEYPLFVVKKQELLQALAAEHASKRLEANPPCTNMGFEDGKFTGWTGSIQDRNTTDDTNDIRPGRVDPRMLQHCVMSPTMRDPYIPTLPVVMPGKAHSVRLGNAVEGGHVARMKQTFFVDSSNMVFTYHYAVVLEDPDGAGGHRELNSPHFQVAMTAENGKVNDCAGYSVVVQGNLPSYTHVCAPGKAEMNIDNVGCPRGATGYDGNPAFENGRTVNNVTNPNRNGSCGEARDFYYRSWTTVSIVLDQYLGQNVTIEFLAADCVPGGHLGYAYISAECSPMKLSDAQPICSGKQTRKLSAPTGFASYQWSGPGIVGDANTQAITINKSGTYQVVLMPKSDVACPDTQQVVVKERCVPMEIPKSMCETIVGSQTRDQVDLTQYQTEILGLTDGVAIASWHLGPSKANAPKIGNPAKFSPKNGDRVHAIVSRGPFPNDTLAIVFEILSKPVLTFPAQAPVCQDQPAFALKGVMPSGGLFSGLHTSATGTFTPQKEGVFEIFYKLTNAAGCTDSVKGKVEVKTKPTLVVSNDQTVCYQNKPLTLPLLATSTSDSIHWKANAPLTNASAKATDLKIEGTAPQEQKILAIATAYSRVCPSVSDTVSVVVYQLPRVQVPNDTVLCHSGAPISLSLNGKASYHDSIRWTSKAAEPLPAAHLSASAVLTGHPSVPKTVTFSLQAFKKSCPVVSDSLTATLVPPPTVQAPRDTTFCTELLPTTLVLRASSEQYDSLVWRNQKGNVLAIAKKLETTVILPKQGVNRIVVTAYKKGCLSASDSLDVSYEAPPKVQATASPTCSADQRVVLKGIVSQAKGFWSALGSSGTFASGTDSIANNAYLPTSQEIKQKKATIKLVSKGLKHCPSKDTTLVLPIPPLPKLTVPDTIVCEGEAASLEANSIQGARYFWQGASLGTNKTTFTIPAVTQTTSVQIKVQDANGCLDSTTATVRIAPKPDFVLAGAQLCPGQTKVLEVKLLTPLKDYQFQWKKDGVKLPISISQLFAVASPGKYELTLGKGGCTTTRSATIAFYPAPKLDMPTHYKHCYETDPPLVLSSPPFQRYAWYAEGAIVDTTRQIAVAPQQPTSYQLKVTNEYGCRDSIQLFVRKVCPPRLFVPNVITPESEDINAGLHIFGAHYTNFEITIFSRWGEVIFNSKDDKHIWDGVYRSENMPIGTYPWIVTYEGDSQEYKGPYKLQGDVTVVR